MKLYLVLAARWTNQTEGVIPFFTNKRNAIKYAGKRVQVLEFETIKKPQGLQCLKPIKKEQRQVKA